MCTNASPNTPSQRTRKLPSVGNLKDEQSEVVKKADANGVRSYHALHVLNTRPATTYLKKVMREGEEA